MAFGDYAQVASPNVMPRNSMVPRTEGSIALLLTGNLQGSARFFVLETKAYVTRHQFVILPIPNEEISKLDELAAKQPAPGLDADLEVTSSSRLVTSQPLALFSSRRR